MWTTLESGLSEISKTPRFSPPFHEPCAVMIVLPVPVAVMWSSFTSSCGSSCSDKQASRMHEQHDTRTGPRDGLRRTIRLSMNGASRGQIGESVRLSGGGRCAGQQTDAAMHPAPLPTTHTDKNSDIPQKIKKIGSILRMTEQMCAQLLQ